METTLPEKNLKKQTKAYGRKRITNLPTIKCICGTEIVVVPNLKVMSKAIRDHLQAHSRAQKDLQRAAVEWAIAEKILIEQLYEFAKDTRKRQIA